MCYGQQRWNEAAQSRSRQDHAEETDVALRRCARFLLALTPHDLPAAFFDGKKIALTQGARDEMERNKKFPPKIKVCHNVNCMGGTSPRTIQMLRLLVSTDPRIAEHPSFKGTGRIALECQQEYASCVIRESECMDMCQIGPNVRNLLTDEIYNEVFNSSVTKGMQILADVGFDIPIEAAAGFLRLEGARVAEGEGNLDEALDLLNEGVKGAVKLGAAGAWLQSKLYEARRDINVQLGNMKEANRDEMKSKLVSTRITYG